MFHRLKIVLVALGPSPSGACLRRGILVSLIGLSCGCGVGGTSYTELKSSGRPPRAADRVELYMSPTAPSCDYEIIATMATCRPCMAEVADMKVKAAAHGADGITNIQCAPPGTVNAGNCTGDVYVCRR